MSAHSCSRSASCARRRSCAAISTDAGRQAREAAEHANLAKTQFLQTMSHEFRTPLNAILGYTEILSEEIVGPVTPLQKDHLRRIRRSSDHLLALIEELLRFARLDAGEELVRTERVLAADVVEETFDIVRALAERKGLQLRSELPDYPIALNTDRVKLRQVLVNVVTNAVKYSDVGEVLVVVGVAGSGAAMRITFEVTDSGRGIAVDDQQHVFEAFWQVHQSLTRASDGTGLGLAVARRLARLLGGDVVLARSRSRTRHDLRRMASGDCRQRARRHTGVVGCMTSEHVQGARGLRLESAEPRPRPGCRPSYRRRPRARAEISERDGLEEDASRRRGGFLGPDHRAECAENGGGRHESEVHQALPFLRPVAA